MRDRMVLPRHAEIRVALERWFILPLDPKATIFVNGESVKGQQRIDEGDLVTIGSATFKATLGETEKAVGDNQERDSGLEGRWRD